MRLELAICAGVMMCGPALAQDVYPGCEVPTTVAGRHTFFVDPVKGSDKGDGSMARPWKSLNTVLAPASKLIATKSHKTVTGSPLLAVNPAAPIKGGDIIMLMSGDYGDVTLMNAFNDKFITVMPAPGQSPKIGHLKVAGAARWNFQGLLFQYQYPAGSSPNANALVLVSDGWDETTSNINFDQNTFQATNDTSSWSDADWFGRPDFVAIRLRATCSAVTNSTVRNTVNGFALIGSKTLIKGNKIDHFSVDAIDGNSSNFSIVNNTISSGMYNGKSSLHPDAIQIWSTTANGKVTVTNQNIVIDSNKILAPKSPDGQRGIMQGITVGFCDNVTITNNVVAVNLWNAILLNGVGNAQVINNTVVSTDPVNHPSKIYVGPSPYKASKNVVIRNNISKDIAANDESIAMDHNVVSRTYSTVANGKVTWHANGISASQNLVMPNLEANFRNWDPAKNVFDTHLKVGAKLDGIGSGLMAPALDADGLHRVTPVAPGAYSK